AADAHTDRPPDPARSERKAYTHHVAEARFMCCFFFSSRRRHTSFDCDWSSDVCSSDLAGSRDLPLRLKLAETLIGQCALDRKKRSEERRVGKEWRARWWPDRWKKKG